MKPYDPAEQTKTSRRKLPHWEQDGCTYFITYRLFDSIPKAKLAVWNDSRIRWLKSKNINPDTPSEQLLRNLSPQQQKQYQVKFWKTYQDMLDDCYGSCLFKTPKNAQVVADALLFFRDDRYVIGNFVIMPNHIHVLVTPNEPWSIKKITHSWKSFTAKAVNKQLKQSGQVWQHESYDHIVRNEEQLKRIQRYIKNNPKNLRPTEYIYHEA